jgi:Flp pilus assembly protein TadD
MTESGDRPENNQAASDAAVMAGTTFAAELALGVEHYRARAYETAADIFLRLAQRRNDDPIVLRMLGLCRLRSGQVAEGAQLLARAHVLAPTDPETRLHYGIAMLAGGHASEAAAHFRACIALLPQDAAPPLNLAAALLQLGDATGALLAARKAKLRAPKVPEAHYTLGLAEMAAGALEAAATSFRQATVLAPRFAEAWVNLGIVRYRLGNIMAARQAMSRALTAAPGHPAATANLAVFLRLTGEMERSETLLRDAVERGGDTAGARVNLATAQLAADRPAEALSLLDGPPPLEPRHALHWRLQRVLALLQLGRVDEARALLDDLDAVPEALMPLLHWRQVLLAVADRDLPAARTAAARMEAALAHARDVMPEDLIMGHFDLARFWASYDDRDHAFALWAEGHRQLARFQPFSRPHHLAFVEASMRQFDHARLHTGPRARSADPAPVFIVGMPRTGTTLADQILAAHREVHGAGERNALALAFEALGGATDSVDAVTHVASLGAEVLEAAAASYLAELHRLAPDATRIVDKMPGNFHYLGLSALMLPGARIIHCVRDPRDIALSIFTFRFYGNHPYAHDIADLGWYIAQYWRLMKHWEAVLPNPILTIRLKDWVEDFDATLRRLLDFLDLPFDAACERFYELERTVLTVSRQQVRSPVNARGLGRWRGFAGHLGPMIEELHRAGIDPDRDWPPERLDRRT